MNTVDQDTVADDAPETILSEFLRGTAKSNRLGLERMAHFTDWRAQAQVELERRTHAILESLPLDVVEALAMGKIDFSAVAKQVLELPSDQSRGNPGSAS